MAKAEASVGELVEMISRGEIQLPEMQRQYVWRATRVRDLFDSLYRGYPSGAILLWDTDEDIALQDFAITQVAQSLHSPKLLLDGQQRLTSLSAVIRGEPVSVRGRKRPIELLFNLDHPAQMSEVTEVDDEIGDDDGETEQDLSDADEDVDGDEDDETVDASVSEIQRRLNAMTFVVKTNRIASLPNWIPVSEVFQSDDVTAIIRSAGVSSMDDPRFALYNDRLTRLRGIRSYTYRLDILERSLSYDEVTEIFVRVNSLGAKLRSSDLALAQITAKWRGSLAEFQDYQQRCAKDGFDLDLGVHLRGLVAMATGQSKFHTVASLDTEQITSAWEEAKRGTDYALNFLRSNCGIVSPALLSSPFLVTTLAYFGRRRDYSVVPAEVDELRRWTLLANAKGRYSRGSSETLLAEDLATLRDGGGPADLLQRLAGQVGRLDVTVDDLAGRNQRSSLFKTLFIAFAADGARDWKTGVQIALDHAGAQDRLQFHHIFPRAVLKGRYRPREIDDLANLAFIGGKTNRQILNKTPAAYLPQLVEQYGVEPFETQRIPLDAENLGVDEYPQFLAARRALLADRLNQFLGTSSGGGAQG